ncbi:MAG: hypothetical protein J6U05_01820 [Neisseriaceae bacterium]|nr:hypothetical protein [Neisseriaceae bacterium]
MKHNSADGRRTSTRTILPEDKQGMSLEQSDFMAISLQEIAEAPLAEEPAVSPMPNIISPRKKAKKESKEIQEVNIKKEEIKEKIKEEKPKEIKELKKEETPNKHHKANPNASSVANRVLEKWGIDRKAAEKITAAGYAPFDAQKNMSKNIRSGRQKKENTQTAEKMLQQTFQAPYQPLDDPEPKPIAIEKPKKAAKSTKKSKNKAKKGSASLAMESLKWAVENSPAKTQRNISADIHSADKAVAKLFRSQRQKKPAVLPINKDETPVAQANTHSILSDEVKAAILPNTNQNKGLRAVKTPIKLRNTSRDIKIKLPERKNKASAVKAVEALRWAVEHNPDKPKRPAEKVAMPELKPMEDDEKPFVEQTHHPISAEELQAIAIDKEVDKE